MKYIVVHGGRAHLDDVMACALAMVQKGPMSQDDGIQEHLARNRGTLPVYRREPTAEELADPLVLVMDVGGKLEPGFSNFDHHQLPREDCRCAMRLLAGHIRVPHEEGGRYPTFAEFLPRIFPWWDTAVMTDQQGPFNAAKAHGLEWPAVKPFIGPLSEVYLEGFSDERISPWTRGHLVYTTLTRWLNTKVSSYFDVTDHIRKDKIGDIEVSDLTECDPRAAASIVEGGALPSVGVCDGVAVHVARPRRDGEDWHNTGLTLTRVGADMRIDFTKVASEPSVRFAHKGGFLAQLKERDMDEAMRLIRIATGKSGS